MFLKRGSKEEEVIRKNMEDLSQEVKFVKIDDEIFTTTNPFQDVLVKDILIHCMKHCIKGGCVIYRVKYNGIEECKNVNLKEKFQLLEVIRVAKSPISIYAMRELKELQNAALIIVRRMNEGFPQCY